MDYPVYQFCLNFTTAIGTHVVMDLCQKCIKIFKKKQKKVIETPAYSCRRGHLKKAGEKLVCLIPSLVRDALLQFAAHDRSVKVKFIFALFLDMPDVEARAAVDKESRKPTRYKRYSDQWRSASVYAKRPRTKAFNNMRTVTERVLYLAILCKVIYFRDIILRDPFPFVLISVGAMGLMACCHFWGSILEPVNPFEKSIQSQNFKRSHSYASSFSGSRFNTSSFDQSGSHSSSFDESGSHSSSFDVLRSEASSLSASGSSASSLEEESEEGSDSTSSLLEKFSFTVLHIEEPLPEEPLPEEPLPEEPLPEEPLPEEPLPEEPLPEEPLPEEPLPEEPLSKEPLSKKSYPKKSLPEALKEVHPEEPHVKKPMVKKRLPKKTPSKKSHPEEPLPKESHPEEPLPKESHPEEPLPKESHPEEPLPKESHPEEPLPKESHPEEPLPKESHPQESHSDMPDGQEQAQNMVKLSNSSPTIPSAQDSPAENIRADTPHSSVKGSSKSSNSSQNDRVALAPNASPFSSPLRTRRQSCPIHCVSTPNCGTDHETIMAVIGCGAHHSDCDTPAMKHKIQFLRELITAFVPPFRKYPTEDAEKAVLFIAQECSLSHLENFCNFLIEYEELFGNTTPPIRWSPSTRVRKFPKSNQIIVCKHVHRWNKKDFSTEALCAAYNNHLKTHDQSNLIYTDASITGDRVGCSYKHGSVLKSFRIQDEQSIFTAELVAIHEALLYSKGIKGTITFATDSAQAIKFITSLSDDWVSTSIRTLMEISGKKYYLCWVPAHVGVLGNEIVDSAAKCATMYNCKGLVTCNGASDCLRS